MHALDDVASMQDAHGGCCKRPSYGVAGNEKRGFCAERAMEGMAPVAKKKSAHLGGPSRPSYDVSGSRFLRTCNRGDPHADGVGTGQNYHNKARKIIMLVLPRDMRCQPS